MAQKKKQSKARKRQLARVRGLRNRLAKKGYKLPAEIWDLGEWTTQKLAKLTPERLKKMSTYEVTARNHAALIRLDRYQEFNIRPGDIVPGMIGSKIERYTRYTKQDYSYTGRLWEIIREAQASYEQPIGADTVANFINSATAQLGADATEGAIRLTSGESRALVEELASREYGNLKMESAITGRSIYNILTAYVVELRNILETATGLSLSIGGTVE